MSVITQETLTANVANQMIALAGALANMQTQINAASAAWTNLGMAAKLNAFPTAALTTTGGLGAADGSPVNTNPINISIAPGSQLNRAFSANNFATLLTYLQGISAAIGGSAVGANGAAVQIVAACQ